MKTWRWLLAMLLFVTTGASAQCTNQSVSYDTTVYGSGSDFYNFSFPKFDPTAGTLTDVNIDARVSLLFGFQLENTALGPISNYRLKLDFFDDVTSDALLNPLSNVKTVTYGPFNFAAADPVTGSGADYRYQAPAYLLNEQQMGKTVYNTGDFMGTGPVTFEFSTASYPTLMGSASVSYIGSVQDEIKFKITYNYCPVSVLASDITTFTANRLTDGNIDIKWIAQNEKTNRKYELQTSTDGRVYRGVAEFIAQAGSTTGAYRYTYQIPPGENKQIIYFRLQLTDKGSSPKFSGARAVKISTGESEKPLLYPNPAKNVTTLLFSNTKRGNWDVQLLHTNGRMVKRYQFNNALSARLNLPNELPRGLYMVRCTNMTTTEQFIQRLLLQ